MHSLVISMQISEKQFISAANIILEADIWTRQNAERSDLV